MNDTPVDRPSSPSIQLMLLIIPTTQKIVRPAATAASKRTTPGPNGLAMKSIVTPAATAADAEQDLAKELPSGAQVEQVVDRAEGGRDRPAEQQRRDRGRLHLDRDGDQVDLLVDDQEDARDEQERRRHGEAAGPRDGDHVDPPLLRLVDDLVADDDPPDDRGQHEGEHRGGQEDDQDRNDGGASGGDEVHRGAAVAGRSVRSRCVTRTAAPGPGSG